MIQQNKALYKTVLTGLMAALCYISFTYLKINIPTVFGGMVALHIGNAFCVLAAILIGKVQGGLAGSIGMTIGDLLSPGFAIYAPKTFLMKFFIGYIAGAIAHDIAKISKDHPRSYTIKWSFLACIGGLGFNVIVNPIADYFYSRFIMGAEATASKIIASWAAGITLTNAVAGTILVVILYAFLRPILKKAGLFIEED